MNDLETIIQVYESKDLFPSLNEKGEYPNPIRKTSIRIASESEATKNKYYEEMLNKIINYYK